MITLSSTGILLINLGTPNSPTPKDLKKYLREFLSDPRVVEIPKLLWQPILRGLVLPLRSGYSAKLYQKIWTEQGSPLLHISRLQQQGLQALLNQHTDTQFKVVLGMRYGSPSISQALEELRAANVQRIIVLPLYPQYAAATVGSAFDAVAKALSSWRVVPKLYFIREYAEHPGYIDALVNQIQRYWQERPAAELLLFSFHGLPQRQVDAGDPYFDQCHKTARLVAERLEYPPERWSVVFQSRFGRAKWLQPYLDPTLRTLASTGVKAVDIICPGFAADCLETLEEISYRSRDVFLAAGGECLNYIPALNDNPEHLAVLADMVKLRLN